MELSWQFTPMALLYVMAVLLSVVLAVLAWRMRPAKGAEWFALLMISAGMWALGYMLGFFNRSFEWQMLMLRVEYLGPTGAPLFWMLFVLSYTHFDRWFNQRVVGLLAIVPLTVYGLVLTVEQHQLMYQELWVTVEQGLVVVRRTYGPAFWVIIGYDYTLVTATLVMLILSAVRHSSMMRGQMVVLMIGASIPMGLNVLYVIDKNPFDPYDPSSLAFVAAGMFGILAMGRFRLLNVVPVAHDLVVRNVNSGVVVIDVQGYVLEVNPVAEQVLGCRRDEVLGQVVFEAFPEHHELLVKFQDVLEVKTEIAIGERFYELEVTPLYGRLGRVSGRIIILYDITEQKRLIAELDAYAHTVAHDLKNPLGIIRGYADFIEEDFLDDLPFELRECVQHISSTSQQMTEIVNALLMLAGVRRHGKVEALPLDMGEVVSGALGRLSRVFYDSGAEVVLPNEWPVALGYGPWVEEVWANYISNAVKYGGSPPVVELGADAGDNGVVRFWVRDNGAGIAEEDRGALFVEFSRLAQHKRSEGHGLGLSIVRRIVERLDGEVGMEQVADGGSRFYFTLPGEYSG